MVFLLSSSSCRIQKTAIIYTSENLKIEQLAPNTYRHISYLSTNDYGKVSCNGMIATHSEEAIVFDTPTNDSVSLELINWISENLKCKTIGVVVTHFHKDCLGGLSVFHKQSIPSYASNRTIARTKQDSIESPQIGFEEYLELKLGNSTIKNQYLGEGHTSDNIVCYYPADNVLFGGCLIKSQGATKGYLGDANTSEWSNTVRKVKATYPDIKIVIPGHGKPGTIELLDYTVQLFEVE